MKVGFLGCGMMGGALARAFISGERLAGEDLFLLDVVPAPAEALATELGGTVSSDLSTLCGSVDCLFLATKPQVFSTVIGQILESGEVPGTIVSIAAGLSLRQLRAWFGAGPNIIRTMPNRPALVGAGVTALMGDVDTASEAVQSVSRLLEAAGAVVLLDDEAQFDAVTALSGSGPAFVFRMIRQLTLGAQSEGLSEESARTLAIATVSGAARMLDVLGTDPADEIRAVASPGGTTVAGLKALDRLGFDPAVVGAIVAAAARSREMGQD